MINKHNMLDYRITCDICDQHATPKYIMVRGTYIAEKNKSLRNDATKHGWTHTNNQDLCPHHTPNKQI